MRTIKRNVNEINTSLSSYNKLVKYNNQLEWKGIIENKNIFTTDQLSQADAKNVYVDDHGSLVSRPVLLREPLSKEILPTNSELVDNITYGIGTASSKKDAEQEAAKNALEKLAC